jgi:HEAT repeat protein
MGGPKTFVNELGDQVDPISQFVNLRTCAEPWLDLLIAYYPRMVHDAEHDMIVRALGTVKSAPAREKAARFLLTLFSAKRPDISLLWAAANSLAILNVRSTYAKATKIAANTRFGNARQMLLRLLGRAKTEEAFHTLLKLLRDPQVRGHALAALGTFGDQRAVPIIRRTPVKKGLYEYKAKETALRQIKRKASTQRALRVPGVPARK